MTTLKVELPPEKVSKAWNEITLDYARYAKIPGFRPGKAPRTVIENKFKKEIKEEVTKRMLSEGCREAISEKKLRVLSLADVEDVEIADDKSMRFTATLITAPEFELPEYKGIPVQHKPLDVTEAELDSWLETLRSQGADFVEITDRGLQMEDFAVIDYAGTIDGKPVDEVHPKAGKPLTANHDFWIRMTPESFFPGFADALLGSKPNDTRSFDVDVPADFAVTEMAGQKIHYEVTVKGVKQKVLPEVNDAWAATVVEGKTLAELRDMGRVELGQQKHLENRRDAQSQIMNYLLSKVECELPSNLVRNETQRILADIVRENQVRGVADEVIKENSKDLIGSASQGAREKVKGTFVLLRIAELEKITVSEAELKARIQSLAVRYQVPYEKMTKELEKREATGQIEEEILVGKVLDFLGSNATVQTSPAGVS